MKRTAQILLGLLLLGALSASAVPLEMSKIFGDNMILQRDKNVRVWGKAPQGTTVTVSFGGKSTKPATVGSDDIWVAQFNETFSASTTGRDLVAKCSDGTSVKKTGVLVGDVWLAGGQSNMVMPLKGSAYGNTYDCDVYEQEINSGKFPYIRLIGLGIGYGKTPKPEYYEVEGTPSWRAADTGWSAVAFHFAREIALKNPNIPIGIIGCMCNGLASSYWQTGGNGGLWNCQLAPIIRMKVRGAIWYQGESDDSSARLNGQSYYREILERLVGGWRREFGESPEDFPFYWVSLAGQKDYSTLDDPSGDKDKEMRFVREGMLRACYTITNSGMCITWDCGRKSDEMESVAWIHPRCKNVPGARLALLARKNVYGETSLVAESPYFKSSQIDGKGHIRIKFDMHGSTGFCSAYKSSKDAKFPVATPNEPIKGFAICGVNHVWEWADVQIEGTDTLVLSSPKVAHPVYARYCYRCNPVDGIATGYNKELLPIAPFATDMTHYLTARGATQGTFADKFKAASSYDGQEAGTCYLTEPGSFVEFSKDFTLKNAVLDLQGAYDPRLASGKRLTLDNAECSYPGRMGMDFTLHSGATLEFVNGGAIWQSPIAASGTDVSLKIVSGVSRCGKLTWKEQAVGQGGCLVLNKGQLKVIEPPTEKVTGDPDGTVTINAGPSIEMTLPATPFEGAVLSSEGAMTIDTRVPLKVDATSVQVANGSSVTIPLLSSKTSLSCATYANSCVTTKSGILATLKKDAQTLNLVLTANGDPSCVHTFVSYGTTQAATCTEAGSQAGKKCSKCGYVSVQEAIIPPLGHAWGAWQTTCAATATADGEEQRACSRCPATETRVLPAGGGATGTYKLAKGGTWSTIANWSGVTSGLYPRLATDSAEVLKTLTSDTTLDLDGKSYAIKAFNATNLSCNLTLKNGSLTFADASYLRVTAAKTLTLENMNLTSTTTSSDYKAHALDPYTDGALIAFKGTNTLTGILLRNYNTGVGYRFENGLTTSDSGFNFGTTVKPFTISLDNARFSTSSLKLENGTVAISVKLGTNNTTANPVLNFTGQFDVPTGSTLAIDATRAAVGRYEIIHANQFIDTAEFAGRAQVTVASGMNYEMEAVPNGGVYLTLTGGSTPSPEPPEEDPDDNTPLTLSTYFQNKMIFQRGVPIIVWGKTTPGKTVSVRFGNGAAVTSSAANAQGVWEATLPAQALSATGQSLVAKVGATTVTISDILVGDVYLCSGQSNMEYAMKTTYDYTDFKSDATTQIRYCRVKQSASKTPESHDLPEKSIWSTSVEVFDSMSATAFYFARAMRRAQPGIPIGLVDNSYGGHRIEGFLAPEMVADSTSLSNTVATASASSAGDYGFMNWNTMYEPLRRVAFKAQLFWQGCSNGDTNMAEATYENYLTRFVNGVRQIWGENLPFYNVQLASNYSWSDAPGNVDKYTKIRNAQFSVFKKLAHTGLVPTVDLFAYDFHPKSKILVGERLARWVRRDLFGENIQAQSPTVATTTYDSGSGYARVTFDSATCGNGLVLGYKTWTDKNEPVTCASLGISTNLNGFAVSTDNKNWYWADEARIESANTVLLKSSKVSAPKYVRFAQMNSPCGWSWVDNKTAALSGPGVNLYAECADGVLLLATPFNTLTGTKETIVPGGHIHVWSDWVTNGVTCTSAGTRTRSCTAADCPIKTETQTVPKLGHDWLAWEVTKPATETETGTKTRSCSRCTATETETIPATGGGDTPSGRLPAGYTEIEYVDTGSAGGAYIDSGIVGQYQVWISAKVLFNESQSSDSYQWLMGSTGETTGNKRCDPFYVKLDQVNMTSQYTYNGPSSAVQVGQEYTIESYTGKKGDYASVYLKLNGQDQALTRKDEFSYVDEIPSEGNGKNMYVGVRQEGSANRLIHPFRGRIYYLQIKVGGNLVRDYVPCVSNNVAGLYDLVKGKFYPSLKTPFTAGPVKDVPTPPAHEHAFGDWTTNAAPTCVKAGERSRTCACGEKQVETLKALGHDYQWVTTLEPTATMAGERQNKCTRCGDVKETSVIPATGGDTPTGRNLPAPFVEVEYVDTGDAGGAYIDTGIVGQYKLWLSAKFSVHTTSARCWLMGSTADNQAHQLCDPFYTSYGQIFVGASYTFTGPKNKVVADKAYTVETYTGEKDRPDSVYLKFDNEQVNLDYTLSSSVTKIADEGNGMTLYLGARQEGKNRATNLFKGRVYSVQLKVGGELVRDYVPCVSNNVAGLYDFVKEKFYPSIGPKPFNAGPAVDPTPSTKNPIINGDPISVESVFEKASSQAPITYPSAPELHGQAGENQTIVFDKKTVAVPTWFNATLSGNVITLEFTGKGAEPVIASEGSSPAFEVSDKGTISIHITNEKQTLWYAVGSKSNFNDNWNWGAWTKGASDFTAPCEGNRSFYTIRVRDYNSASN